MTREKAILVLKAEWRSKETDFSDNVVREALDMAIKALEAEPCEDAISRQQALHEISFCGTGHKAMQIIAELPSVTPARPKGKWIEYTRVLIPEPINKWEQAWYCSECGYGNQDCEEGSAWLEWKYCPICGADMRGEQDEEIGSN